MNQKNYWDKKISDYLHINLQDPKVSQANPCFHVTLLHLKLVNKVSL